jgi:prepilin-type N-terminal cleavage/methylation domain-containing protein
VSRRTNAAFTLLELLVVIAIIALLMTLVTLGVRSVNKSARDKATRTMMENLKGFVTERTNTGGMSAIYDLYNRNTNFNNGQPLPQPAPDSTQIGLPDDVKPGGGSRLPAIQAAAGANPAQPRNEVGRTRMVMYMLRAVPMNAKMMAQLPADSFLRPAPSNAAPFDQAPVPVDGWGNPMIFVPGGGLNGITVTGAADSSGKVQTAFHATIVSPDGKGFWASAGPDGVFTDNDNATPVANRKPYGDDNIYSFEN